MHSETQQRKLDYLVERLHHTVSDKAYSLLVVGSYAHSRDFAIKDTTDLDAMIICENKSIDNILSTECYEGYSVNLDEAMKHLKVGDTHLMSTRHSYNDCLFTVHFMNPDIFFNLFMSPEEKRIFSFRKIKKDYIYRFQNFDGSGFDIRVENYPVSDGFLVPMDTCLVIENKYYLGSPHNKMLSAPLIYFDKTEMVSKSVLELKKSLILKMIKEHGADVNQNNISLLNTLVRKAEINPEVLETLRREELELLS